jgi:hypothetical protein
MHHRGGDDDASKGRPPSYDDGHHEQTQDVVTSTNNASTEILCDSPPEYEPVLSKRRWLILMAVGVYGFCMALNGGTASILDQVLKLLDLNVDSYIYVGQIIDYLVAIIAVPLAIFLDKFGIRAAIHAATCFFILSSVFRCLLYFTELPFWSQYKMYFYITSMIFSAPAMTMFFLLPLKVSEAWFPKSERSTAWMIMWQQTDVAICICAVLYPRIILDVSDFKFLAYISIASTILCTLTCVIFVTKSEPKFPPSERAAAKDTAPVLVALSRLFRQKDLMLHQFHSSIYASANMALGEVIQNVLSSIGYSQIFAGNYLLITASVSIVLSIIMSRFVHKVNNATLACKLGSFIQVILFSCLQTAFMVPLQGWIIICIAVALTCCRSWTIPHFNDMTARLSSGVVSQPTIVGFSLVITPILMRFVKVIFAHFIVIHDKANDYHDSLIFLIGLCVANELVYQIFFWGKPSNQPTNNEQSSEQRT